ncbi:MAG: MFS transporter [Sphingomonadales bacterium]|nr:MFS transporter [Sphingomonadales bacterium]
MILSARDEWKRGWGIVAAAATGMGTGVGLYTLTSGLFIQPLEQAFGWSRAEIAALAMFAIVSSFIMPLMGLLIDRIGARRVAAAGMLFLSIAYASMTTLNGQLIQLYILGTLLAVIGVATTPMIFTRPIGLWFDKARGTAIGLTLSGVSVTAALCFPLLQYMIANYGWQAGYLTLAAISLFIGLPVVGCFMRDQPSETALHPTHKQHPLPISPVAVISWAKVVRDERFWLLLAAMIFANIPVGGILSQLLPILGDRGVDPKIAALLGSVFAISIAVGRIGAGFLLDRLWAPGVAAACLLMPIAGLFAMMAPEPHFIIVAISVMLFGFAQGAEIDFIAYFVPRYFGMTMFGAIIGVIMLVTALSLAAGGLIFAGIYDVTGSYMLAFWVGIGAFPIGALCILATGKRRNDMTLNAATEGTHG